MPRPGTIDRRASRMAPGGRVSSESRIEHVYPLVGDAGEEPPLPAYTYSVYQYQGSTSGVASANVITMPGGSAGSLKSHGIFLTVAVTATEYGVSRVSVPNSWQILRRTTLYYTLDGAASPTNVEHVIAVHHGIPSASDQVWSFGTTSWDKSMWATFYVSMNETPPDTYPITWDLKWVDRSYPAYTGSERDIIQDVGQWPTVTDSSWIAAFPLSGGLACSPYPHDTNSHGGKFRVWNNIFSQTNNQAKPMSQWWRRDDNIFTSNIVWDLSLFAPNAVDKSGNPWQLDQSFDIYPAFGTSNDGGVTWRYGPMIGTAYLIGLKQ